MCIAISSQVFTPLVASIAGGGGSGIGIVPGLGSFFGGGSSAANLSFHDCVAAGRLRASAISSAARDAMVPTMTEIGFPGLLAKTSWG